MERVLLIGSSGRVGTKLREEFNKNSDGVEIVLSTSKKETAEKWESEGKNAVVLDLNNPETFSEALRNIDRVFLLTGYSSDMLFQGKMLIDAAKDAGVKYIVHLGVFTSRKDPVPHFVWHDLLESYIAASGIAWTNIHPNVITESVLDINPGFIETGVFTSMCGDAPQGWACTKDIAEVAATVLREGPEKHNGKDYYISIDVLRASEVASILSQVSGREIKYIDITKEQQEEIFKQIPSVAARNYMASAVVVMQLTREGKFKAQTAIADDVFTVTGHKGTTMKEWAEAYCKGRNF